MAVSTLPAFANRTTRPYPRIAIESDREGRALLCDPSAGLLQGCGEVFCSTACLERSVREGHELLCTGPCDTELHPLVQFKARRATPRCGAHASAPALRGCYHGVTPAMRQ